jgi:hypothetical protein
MKIIFNAASDSIGLTGNDPAPAVKAIPFWYRKMEKFINGVKMTDGTGKYPLTIKACPPFLDSMMSGYVIFTEFDLFVRQTETGPMIEWKYGGNLIGTHLKEQIVPEQIPPGFSPHPIKFHNFWQIKTPRGYSTLFTHPLNRNDLPFLTLSGVVETDTFENLINFPALMREDFSGEIPAGTPIVQLFPFKRESWVMEKGVVDKTELEQASVRLNHKFMNSYKFQWWQRKEYK